MAEYALPGTPIGGSIGQAWVESWAGCLVLGALLKVGGLPEAGGLLKVGGLSEVGGLPDGWAAGGTCGWSVGFRHFLTASRTVR